MSTEAPLQRYRDAEQWPIQQAPGAMLEDQFGALVAVRPAIPRIAAAVSAAAGRLGQSGRLIYAGAGASGRLAAQDGVKLYSTFASPVAGRC